MTDNQAETFVDAIYNDIRSTRMHKSDLDYTLKRLITQATAELRVEVEAQIQANNRLVDHVDKLTTERDQAQAQVAALVRVIERSVSVESPDFGMLKITVSGPMTNDIAVDAQATAEAHDAKVRQEAREAAILECIGAAILEPDEPFDAVKKADPKPDNDMDFMQGYACGLLSVRKTLQALISKPDGEKGGNE